MCDLEDLCLRLLAPDGPWEAEGVGQQPTHTPLAGCVPQPSFAGAEDEILWSLSLASHNPRLMESMAHMYIQLRKQFQEAHRRGEVRISALREEQESQLASLLEVTYGSEDMVVRSDITSQMVLKHEDELRRLAEELAAEDLALQQEMRESFWAVLRVSAPDAVAAAAANSNRGAARKPLSLLSSLPLQGPLEGDDSAMPLLQRREERLRQLGELCNPCQLTKTASMSLFSDPRFPPSVVGVSIANHLRAQLRGSRPQDPALAPIVLEVSPLWELRRSLRLGAGKPLRRSTAPLDGLYGCDGADVETCGEGDDDFGDDEDNGGAFGGGGPWEWYFKDLCTEDPYAASAARNSWVGGDEVVPEPPGATSSAISLALLMGRSHAAAQGDGGRRASEFGQRCGDVPGKVTALAVHLHLLRLARGHHAVLLILGSQEDAEMLISSPANPELLLRADEHASPVFTPLRPHSELQVAFTTKLWGANVVLLCDPYISSSNPSCDIPRSAVAEAVHLALSWGADLFSVAVLPRKTDLSKAGAATVTRVALQQLRESIAQVQLNTSNTAQMSGSDCNGLLRILDPRALAGETASPHALGGPMSRAAADVPSPPAVAGKTTGSASVSTTAERVKFNLPLSVRFFVPFTFSPPMTTEREPNLAAGGGDTPATPSTDACSGVAPNATRSRALSRWGSHQRVSSVRSIWVQEVLAEAFGPDFRLL